MLNKRFVRRQLASSRKQAVVFVLCVALSMVTLVALGGFSASVNRALLQDARQLQAADIIVSSNTPFSEPLTGAMDAVTPYALRRIEAAADLWLSRQPDHARISMRFDMIAVLPWRWPVHVIAIHP